jgi:hypothetical protein
MSLVPTIPWGERLGHPGARGKNIWELGNMGREEEGEGEGWREREKLKVAKELKKKKVKKRREEIKRQKVEEKF